MKRPLAAMARRAVARPGSGAALSLGSGARVGLGLGVGLGVGSGLGPLNLGAGVPARCEAAEAEAEAKAVNKRVDLVGAAQAGIQGVKDTTGLPWWASIIATTAVVRTVTLPLLPVAAHAAANLAQSMPAFTKLNSLFYQEMRQVRLSTAAASAKGLERAQKLNLYIDGFSKITRLYKVSFARLLLAPAAQIGALGLFIFAMRRSVGADREGGDERPTSPLSNPVDDPRHGLSPGLAPDAEPRPPPAAGTLPGMGTGGVLWFRDLTQPDESLRLPVAALALSYTNLELSFAGAAADVAWLKVLRDYLQLGLIFAGPTVATLPSGVFVYWIS
eukprot:CAMPEP_0118876428 /NCGR_PEP_ID=MMETSP1163-20130328/17130_1 /TAXON_ID=124430 /ORGANISM="Phaeomonas parva, Strain CCMP2877" /LENGTH=330 /DNA_ID=CAMNT_0006812037 /DNA_START=187 /DNA_END=1176 /DNA_ORIENTATION=+